MLYHTKVYIVFTLLQLAEFLVLCILITVLLSVYFCLFWCIGKYFSVMGFRAQTFHLNTYLLYTTHCLVMGSMLVEREISKKRDIMSMSMYTHRHAHRSPHRHTHKHTLYNEFLLQSVHVAKLARQKCSVSAPSVLLHIVASGVKPQ